MAEVLRYVDTDVSGGAGDGTSWADAYSSLNAWEAAEQTNLVSAGDTHRVLVRASSGTDDTTTCDIDGWTTSDTYFIHVEAASTDYVSKTAWDTAKWITEARLRVRIGSVKVEGVQFGAQSFANILGIEGTGSGKTVWIWNCRFRNTSGTSEDIEVTSTVGTVNIWNNILAEADGTTDLGIQSLGAATVNIYNNVIRDRSTGILISSAGTNTTVKNNAIFNCTDDISDSASSTIDYNASDDGDGTNAVSPSGGDWDNEFTDSANGDVTNIGTGNIVNGGIGPSSDSNVNTSDIDGDTRSGTTCDIGVDEYVAPVTGGPVAGSLSLLGVGA